MAKYTIQSIKQTGKSPLETALINLRGELEDQFPKTTFIYGINQDNERLYLYWGDGPEVHQVQQVASKYTIGVYLHEVEAIRKTMASFNHTFGSAKDIQYDRKVSDKFMLAQIQELAKPPVPTHLTGNEEAEALEFKENARKTGEAKAKMQKTIKTLLDNGFTYPQLKEMHYTRLLTEYNAIEARKKFFVV